MSSTFWRRLFLSVYVAVMVLVSIRIVTNAYTSSEMVRIDDREEVLRRRSSSVLTSITIDDPCWKQVTITDHEFLFEMSQQISSIPQVTGQFPGEAPGKISGIMEFADGTEVPYSISTVLCIGQTVYYSPLTEETIGEIRKNLSDRLYTLENLASFVAPNHQITLGDGTQSLLLSPENMDLLREAIEAGEPVEDLDEVRQTVGERTPRYIVTVRSEGGADELYLWVYANESTLVYDAYSSGRRLVFCFSGELVPLCQGMLKSEEFS